MYKTLGTKVTNFYTLKKMIFVCFCFYQMHVLSTETQNNNIAFQLWKASRVTIFNVNPFQQWSHVQTCLSCCVTSFCSRSQWDKDEFGNPQAPAGQRPVTMWASVSDAGGHQRMAARELVPTGSHSLCVCGIHCQLCRCTCLCPRAPLSFTPAHTPASLGVTKRSPVHLTVHSL
jgi:hypothetical protein